MDDKEEELEAAQNLSQNVDNLTSDMKEYLEILQKEGSK
jgi:hypothetical protein